MISNNMTSRKIADSGSSKQKSDGAARLALLNQLYIIKPSSTSFVGTYHFSKSCGAWYGNSDQECECWARRLVLWFECDDNHELLKACASSAGNCNVFGICSFERVLRSDAKFTGFFILVPFECDRGVRLDNISKGRIIGFLINTPEKDKKIQCITKEEDLRSKLDLFSPNNSNSKGRRKAGDKKFEPDPSLGRHHVSNDASQRGGEVNKALEEPSRRRARLEHGSCLSSRSLSSGTEDILSSRSSSCIKSDTQAGNDSESNSSKYGYSNSQSFQNCVSDNRAQGDLPGSEYVKGSFMYKVNPGQALIDVTNVNCFPASYTTCSADDNYSSPYYYQDTFAEDFFPHTRKNISPLWADKDSIFYNKAS